MHLSLLLTERVASRVYDNVIIRKNSIDDIMVDV